MRAESLRGRLRYIALALCCGLPNLAFPLTQYVAFAKLLVIQRPPALLAGQPQLKEGFPSMTVCLEAGRGGAENFYKMASYGQVHSLKLVFWNRESYALVQSARVRYLFSSLP